MCFSPRVNPFFLKNAPVFLESFLEFTLKSDWGDNLCHPSLPQNGIFARIS